MESLTSFILLVRIKDWIKNIFLFAPLFFTPTLFHFSDLALVFIGAILFGATASSIYILNDINDAATDRLHPTKKNRPIADEKITITTAYLFFFILSVIGLVGSALLSIHFFLAVIIYYVINIAYCIWLKHIAIIDIYCIASGFVLRVIAGAALINVAPSVWILMCTGLLALFIALAKRRDDLITEVNEAHRISMRGYHVHFIDV